MKDLEKAFLPEIIFKVRKILQNKEEKTDAEKKLECALKKSLN